ncbi:MAG TPA: hypothetical protein VI546_02510, partial [candidate division Zixibacteria bacterium]|nr:hypothetical protein [candidate division Zixibacteria bacterium]
MKMCWNTKMGIMLLNLTPLVLFGFIDAFSQSHKNLPAGSNPTLIPDSNGAIYAVYQQKGHSYFSKSIDGGTNFRAGVKVEEDSLMQVYEEKPYVSVMNGQIFLAWIQERTSPESAFIAHSALSGDDGLSFSPGWSVTGTRKFWRPYRPKSTYSDSGKGVIINVMEIARRESLSPPPQRKPKVVPFMPVPENIPLAIIGDLDIDERRTVL